MSIEFKDVSDGVVDVEVEGQRIGRIIKGIGLDLGPMYKHHHVGLSPDILQEITDKTAEVLAA
mgnify:CR=1 FL=1|jgi:hypothetical protein